MSKYFENKLTYNQISFCLSNKLTPDEREIHPYHEILLYINGDAILLTKNGQRTLKANSILLIPKETYHFFRFSDSDEFLRLKISFYSNTVENTPLKHLMSEIRIFENLTGNAVFLFERLHQIFKNRNDKIDFYAYSAFLMLVTELDIMDMSESADYYTTTNDIPSSIMEYISENFSKDLSIKTLSSLFHISASSISHMFKKEFGISIHKYIMQNKLFYARKLIHKGIPLSKIYTDIGFMDYSSFYKSYINFFSYPPSEEKYRALPL